MALRNCLTLGTGASSHRRQQPSPHPLCRPLSRCVRGRESCRTRRKLQLRGRRRCRRNRSSDSNSSSKESLRLPSSKAALAITPGTRLEDWNVAIVPSEQFVWVRLTSVAAEAGAVVVLWRYLMLASWHALRGKFSSTWWAQRSERWAKTVERLNKKSELLQQVGKIPASVLRQPSISDNQSESPAPSVASSVSSSSSSSALTVAPTVAVGPACQLACLLCVWHSATYGNRCQNAGRLSWELCALPVVSHLEKNSSSSCRKETIKSKENVRGNVKTLQFG